MLRLLQSSKDPYGASGSSSSSSHKGADVLSLVLDIPTYGAVFMNTPDDPLRSLDQEDSAAAPRNDVVIRGELVITVPASLGRRRIKGIKVGIRSILTLDLRPGRMNEMDTLFERSVELGECSTCTMILEPGTSIFDFTLILPANHPPHDWHNNGTLRHFLYAEIEGMPKASKGKDAGVGFLGLRSRSYGRDGKGDGHKSPRSGHASPARTPRLLSPVGSRSSSPARRDSYPRGLDAALLQQASSMRIDERDLTLEKAPSYDESESGAITPPTPSVSTTPEEWLKGTYKTERTLMLVYNPSSEGEVTVLDLHFNGVAEGLGIWDVTLTSNPWTISALLKCHLNFTSISPAATIYCFRVSLVQTHSITSPRDDPATTTPVVSARTFMIHEQGRRPPGEHPFPKRDWPALWRGTDAGGKDAADLDLNIKGRLPSDDSGRPSTVPGVKTPIKVSHSLQLEVFFSVYGQDQQGQTMKTPGPGGSRLLKIHRPVIVPSCIFVHQFVELPSYEDTKRETFHSKTINVACPVCGVRPSERLCTTCPAGLAPHPRHDHDPKRVGDPSGRCRMCSQGSFPEGSGHQNCACGMSIEQMDSRMERVVQEERGETHHQMVYSDKEEIERGRSRR